LAIIGDEGEDVTALIAAKSEPKTESESAKSENKEAPTTPEATKEKNNIYSACKLYQRGVNCHHD
jgi:pyruvate dehydrogenase E2 component (dihydrolipoamide acetyltransferase)